MTDIDVYQPAAGLGQYQAGIVMTPEAAKALDDQLRACTTAVLRPGTDYGVIPGTDGKMHLLKPGAEKLLQWFGFGYTMNRTEIDVDDDGVRQGVTYRCTVIKRLGDGVTAEIATCEGYAGYDEPKFFQPVTDAARHKAEARERGFAKKDGRVADPTKWKNLVDYRAPWNTIIKMAQKRAVVGATIDAAAAAGLFSAEEDQGPVADDGSTWYEQAIEAALTFTGRDAGAKLYTEAAQAHRDGLCSRRQQDHVQNTITQRVKLLKTATPVDVEDLGHQTAAAGDGTRSQRQAGPAAPPADEHGAGTAPAAAGGAPSRVAQPLPPLPGEDEESPDPTQPAEPAASRRDTDSSTAPDADGPSEPDETDYDTPGTATNPQITAIWTVLTGVYKFSKDEKDQARAVCAHIAGHPLDTTKNMSANEARAVLDTLASWRELAEHHDMAPREFLIELLATAEKEAGGDE